MKKPQEASGHRRHARIVMWSLLVVLVGSLAFPLGGYLYVALGTTQAVAADQADSKTGVNPIANYWRTVREGDSGYSAASGPYTTDNFIVSSGETWREVRNGYVGLVVAWLMAAVLLLIVLFYAVIGKKRLEGSTTGRTLVRWSGGERLLHWYTATLFILLALTGFSLLFGRAVLIPLLGLEGFSAYANVAKPVHDFLGPLFLVGVVLEVITWMRFNLFKSYDWTWLKMLGGMLRKDSHPPAGRANAGEKIWFWFIAIFGLLGVGISGLVLDFPNFGQGRETMQIANIIHASLAGLWVAISFGHIYLGTIGVEGALQGMTKGRVSETWMKQHHSRWYETMQASGEERQADSVKSAAGSGSESASPP